MELSHLVPNAFLVVFTVTLFSNCACYVVPDSTNTLKVPKSRVPLWNMTNCFRQVHQNTSIEDPLVRCVAPKMLNEYEKLNKTGCANCAQYFHCKANYRAVDECGNSLKTIQLATRATECKEVTNISVGDPSFIAAANGRNRSDCRSLYLCAAKCTYSEETGICSPSNCNQ